MLLDYPYLKSTNTGALVLWNFLWALLQDVNYKHVAMSVATLNSPFIITSLHLHRWTSFVELKFRIVDCELLAKKWGTVKQNQAMDWNKIRKVGNTFHVTVYCSILIICLLDSGVVLEEAVDPKVFQGGG